MIFRTIFVKVAPVDMFKVTLGTRLSGMIIGMIIQVFTTIVVKAEVSRNLEWLTHKLLGFLLICKITAYMCSVF